MVELPVGYGAEDCPAEELAAPEELEAEIWPELNGPIVGDEEDET